MQLFWFNSNEGLWCFHNLTDEYGIKPSVEQYIGSMCIIDLPRKSDLVSIAKKFCKKMHTQPHNLFLAPIVSAYGSHCVDSSMDLVYYRNPLQITQLLDPN
jgi:hypothetical protein